MEARKHEVRWNVLWNEPASEVMLATHVDEILDPLLRRSKRQDGIRRELVIDISFLDVPTTRDIDTEDRLVGFLERLQDRDERCTGWRVERESKDAIENDVCLG